MEMTNDEKAEMIAFKNGHSHYCENCDDCCRPYDSTDDCFKSAMEMAKWKDEIISNEAEMINASVSSTKSRVYAALKLSKFFEIEIKLRVCGQEICTWCYPPKKQTNSNSNSYEKE